MKKLATLFSFSLLLATYLYAEEQQQATENTSLRGKYYVFWGWNRDRFTRSDIHMSGPGYDYVLNDVKARDIPIPFGFSPYLNPTEFTIPQTNFRLGTYLNDRYSIAFGFDHMKYYMVRNQEVTIDGTISGFGAPYDGAYNGTPFVIDEDFLKYENSDGLNYLFIAAYRHFPLWEIPKLKSQLTFLAGADVAWVWPWTNATFVDHDRHDVLGIGGVGTALTAGLALRIGKSFTIRSELKGGYVNLFDVNMTDFDEDKAHHDFFFLQSNLLFGAEFRIRKLSIFKDSVNR